MPISTVVNKHLKAISVLAVLLVLSACSSSVNRASERARFEQLALESTARASLEERSSPEQQESNSQIVIRKIRPDNQVAPGYLVKLQCDEDEQINGEFRVAYNSTLKLPYNIRIKTEHLTLDGLKQKIVDLYRPYFRSTPNITISFPEKTRYVQVGGLVTTPGQYLVRNDASLDELIAAAGGLQKDNDGTANAQFVKVEQLGATEYIKLADYYSGTQNLIPYWQGGDAVFFQSSGGTNSALTGISPDNIQILGQVHKPGEYYYKSGADFFHYLVQAGGPTDRANMNNLMVVRSNGTETQSLRFSLDETEKVPAIHGGDIILVHAENPSDVEKGSQVFGTFGSFVTSVLLLFAI